MKERTILHVDVNNFFASVECATKPELKSCPVAVTGNPDKRTGIILAKNEIAKSFGVKTGEAIWESKRKCPDLICLAPHYDQYEKISKQLHELYLQYTDLIEPMGLDECWLDVTSSLKYLGKTGAEIADEIREKVKEKFGITVSVGVSFSKIFAKLGSDMKKPDGTTIIPFASFKKIIYPLPLNSIIGIGRRLDNKFTKMNVNTIGEFVALDEKFVSSVMGKTGEELHQKLSGDLIEPVNSYYDLTPPKSIGNGTTTIIDVTTREDISNVVAFLCEKIATRMANGQFEGSTISVSIKTNKLERFHHSKTTSPKQSYEDIFDITMKLIDSFWKYDKPVRAIRVCVSSLNKINESVQLSFFEETNKLNKGIQEVKEKFGKNKIYLASDTFSYINRKNDEESPSNH